MNIELSHLFWGFSLIITSASTFFITKHGIKDHIRDKFDELNKQINLLKLEIKDLEKKDEIQQMLIDNLMSDVKNILSNK